MSSVAVIDYGMGNLHSIAKALQHADTSATVLITADVAQLKSADRIVFPGVGAMRDCLKALASYELTDTIKELAQTKPFLGICLGMQALLTVSEEHTESEGLNIIPGQVVRFNEGMHDADGHLLKIPHMGWNQVKQITHPLWANIADTSRFYFVHSYYAKPNDTSTVIATADYPTPFACALAKNNLFAVQFHPEKSQAAGLQLLKNFLLWDGQF